MAAQQALSELLGALGFEAMARDVLGETDDERLRKYARVVLKNTRDTNVQRQLYQRFCMLKLA